MMKYKSHYFFCYYLAIFLVIEMNKISTIVFLMVLFAKIKTTITEDFPTISFVIQIVVIGPLRLEIRHACKAIRLHGHLLRAK